MFKKEGINKILLESLYTLQNNILFKDYYLVGGTALTLHIGHRISDDIDLFTNKPINKEEIKGFIKDNMFDDIRIINNGNKIFQLFSDKGNLKFDFVELPYKLINPLIKEDGMRVVSMDDIAAMKISATGTRGSEAKDFYDIYYMLKYMTIDKIFDNFKQKYETNDILHYVRSAMYFDDVENDSWNGVKLLRERISKEEVIKKITNEVMNYQRNVLFKNNIMNNNKNTITSKERNINVQIDTILDKYINKANYKNTNPELIARHLFTNMVDTRKYFEKIVKKSQPEKNLEYAKGYNKILEKACNEVQNIFKNGETKLYYLKKFQFIEKQYNKYEAKHFAAEDGDFNDGMYKASLTLRKCFSKTVQMITNYKPPPPSPVSPKKKEKRRDSKSNSGRS